jgi:hypothetical protein
MYMEPDGDDVGRQTQRPAPAKPLQETTPPSPEVVYEKEPDKYASAIPGFDELPMELNGGEANRQITPSLVSGESQEKILNDGWTSSTSLSADKHASLSKEFNMALNKDVEKRANEKLASMLKRAEEPGQYNNNDLGNSSVQTDQSSRLPAALQAAVMNPYEAAGGGVDLLSQASTGQDIFSNMKDIGLGNNALIRALGNVYNSGR